MNVYVLLILLFVMAPMSMAGSGDQLSLIGKTMSSGFEIGYFDNEGNTPATGSELSSINYTIDPTNQNISILNMHMTIPAGDSNYIWWYIYPRNKTIDISDQTVLRFEINVDPGIPLDHLQIGVRSPNVNSDLNKAKVFLSELGYSKPDKDFVNIEVPVSLLLEREPSLDLKKMSEVFIVAIVAPEHDLIDKTVSIRKIRWDWDFAAGSEGKLKADISSSFSFDFGSYTLKDEAKQLLNRIKKALVNRKVKKLLISGHTDNVGSDKLNQALSEKRAKAIADFLIRIKAIDASGITTKGYGSSKPAASNDTEQGRSANRRVELTILE